jgi:mycofactocin system FadH/OYE family oxidoreductase 1
MSASLTESLLLAGRWAPSRVLFGPQETNLGNGRAFSERHAAYYARRARGGAGVIVLETASVHDSDWPYECAPLAAEAGPGWRMVAEACRPYASLVLAGLGHTGSQGSSAYSQAALWAPSRVADVTSRELPAEMTAIQIGAVVESFVSAAVRAVESDLAGVEIDAGQSSLLRQFCSGLTNERSDRFGTDRSALLIETLRAVRDTLGRESIIGLRLSCDELAPWAGITADSAVDLAVAASEFVDYLVPVRGAPMSASAYRPDGHTEPGFNRDMCSRMRAAVDGRALVVLQGSVADAGMAQEALDDATADLVEMTRAQIAEPDLVALVRAGQSRSVRPCTLCNQFCRVRDPWNPVVSCVGEPHAGHESEPEYAQTVLGAPTGGRTGLAPGTEITVVGAGPGGLEAARVLAAQGHRVTVLEQAERSGGMLRTVAKLPGQERFGLLADWLEAEVLRLGVHIEFGRRVSEAELDGRMILATGSVAGPRHYTADCPVIEACDLLVGDVEHLVPDGPVVITDTLGDGTGVGIAELLAATGRPVTLVTPDPVAGAKTARTGDLADANGRLQRAGVQTAKSSALVSVADGVAVVRHLLTDTCGDVKCTAVVHNGYRRPHVLAPALPSVGDCVAPRTVHHAILEGRRAALALASAGVR